MIAFVVLTHSRPQQVRRLVERLQPHPVLVHVDARARAEVWKPIADLSSTHGVELLPRFRSGWASWGLVQATLAGLARAATKDASHVVVITGQDYLLRPVDEIAEFLAARPGTSWLHAAPVPVPARRISDPDGGVSRVTRWHLTIRGRHLRIPVRRSLPEGLVAHYGQLQSCLATPLARWVVEQVDRRPELTRFFRRTQAPDEWLVSTVAMSSPFATQITDDNLWYMDWSRGGPHPKVLTSEDYDGIAAAAREGSDMGGPSRYKFFARKFDRVASAALLDRIDAELLGRPESGQPAGGR